MRSRAIFDAATATLIAAAAIVLLADALFGRIDAGEISLNTALIGWRPVGALSTADAVLAAVARSLALLAVTLCIASALGITAALVHASTRWAPLRALLWLTGTVGASLPAFFWAIAAQLVIVTMEERTGTPLLPAFGFGLDEHLVLPAFALGLRPASYVFRLSASAIDEVKRGDHVRTATAKGLTDFAILRRHILVNAMPGIAASVAFGARAALSSLAIVEFFFGWGGAGVSFIHAVVDRSAGVAVVLLLTFIVLSSALGAVSASLAVRRAEAR